MRIIHVIVTVDLTALLASSRDWDTLEWAWKEWREVSGKLMKDDYEQFVGLLNEAAKINRKYCLKVPVHSVFRSVV